jgi:hypothetical protein
MAHLFRDLGPALRGALVDPWVPVDWGQVLALSRGEKGWCAAVGTPRGTFLRGGCLPLAYRGEGVYDSRTREPSAPHEREALRWGVGKMVELTTGRPRDLGSWEAPGLLFEGFWGKGLLGLYWKREESDFLELWTPEGSLRLGREKDPDPWWALHDTLWWNSRPMGGFLREVYPAYGEFRALLPPPLRELLG